MIDILVKDNFCHSIDELRELALSSRYILDKYFPSGFVSWRGYRTWELSYLNHPLVTEYSEKILSIANEYYNLKDQALGKFFHVSYKEHETTKWHTDATLYAGVLYLTPNPSSDSGTTIFLDDERRDIENKYNRLVIYPGNSKHGITSFFGDTKRTGRMTFTFFITDKDLFKKDLFDMDNIRNKYDHPYLNYLI